MQVLPVQVVQFAGQAAEQKLAESLVTLEFVHSVQLLAVPKHPLQAVVLHDEQTCPAPPGVRK